MSAAYGILWDGPHPMYRDKPIARMRWARGASGAMLELLTPVAGVEYCALGNLTLTFS